MILIVATMEMQYKKQTDGKEQRETIRREKAPGSGMTEMPSDDIPEKCQNGKTL